MRRLLTSPGEWTRTEAAYALWRLTGDPGPAVPVLVEASAVGHLIRMGSAAAVPLLDGILREPRRPPIERHRSALAFVMADDALVTDAVSARAGTDSRV